MMNPQEFFNHVVTLKTRKEVTQACNALLDEMRVEKGWQPKTIKSRLTPYKKLFYVYVSPIAELNETIKGNTNHCAGMLLTLDKEENISVKEQDAVSALKKSGFDTDGNALIDDQPIDASEVISTAIKLLQCSDATQVIAGILLLTGRRAWEASCLAAIDNDGSEILRSIKVVDEFTLGFSSLSKKRGSDDWFVIPTLCPSQLIYDAYKRLEHNTKWISIQRLTEEQFNNSVTGFRKALDKECDKYFSPLLHKKVSPHKLRSTYTALLVANLKIKDWSETQITEYLRRALAHKDVSECNTYKKDFNANNFQNLLDSLQLPENINEIGENIEMPIVNEAKVKTSKPQQIVVDELELLINKLPLKIQESVRDLILGGLSKLDAIAQSVGELYEQKEAAKQKPQVKPEERIPLIIDEIEFYNVEKETIEECIYPSYPVVSEIHKNLCGELFAKDKLIKADKKIEILVQKGIDKLEMHNSKHHRKDAKVIIEVITSRIKQKNDARLWM